MLAVAPNVGAIKAREYSRISRNFPEECRLRRCESDFGSRDLPSETYSRVLPPAAVVLVSPFATARGWRIVVTYG